MVTWLTRSLLFIVAGAVLAYAVTAQTEHIDLQTTGVILLLVGVFDLLLNAGLELYYRSAPRYERRSTTTSPYPQRGDNYATRPIRRDPDWH
ncbi:MAG TPA: hypothetical protein VF218_07480 [Acidothermaceae bacterium]|jgi:hypothetical protein